MAAYFKAGRSYLGPALLGLASLFGILASSKLLADGVIAHLHVKAADTALQQQLTPQHRTEIHTLQKSWMQTRNHKAGSGSALLLFTLAGIYLSTTRAFKVAARREEENRLFIIRQSGQNLLPQMSSSWMYYRYLCANSRLQHADQLLPALTGRRLDGLAKNDPHFD